MDWNKIQTEKKWKPIDITAHGGKYTEPIATIDKRMQSLYLSAPACEIALAMGLEHKFVDVLQAGGQFAVTLGSQIPINLYRAGTTKGHASAHGSIGYKAVCEKMYAATKCKTFRVSREDKYLVFTPAYDLSRPEVSHE